MLFEKLRDIIDKKPQQHIAMLNVMRDTNPMEYWKIAQQFQNQNEIAKQPLRTRQRSQRLFLWFILQLCTCNRVERIPGSFCCLSTRSGNPPCHPYFLQLLSKMDI